MDVGIVEVAIAVVATAITWHFARRAELQLANWLSEVRAWAAECVDTLATARVLVAEPGDAISPARRECAARLSALVDRGRFFLPNEPRDNADDLHKPLAYRGYRPASLDPLMAAYRLAAGDDTVLNPADVMFELQREFVSEVYRVLQPERYTREIAKMIRGSRRSRQSDPYVGGLLPGGEIPRGAEAVLRQAVARAVTKNARRGSTLPNR